MRRLPFLIALAAIAAVMLLNVGSGRSSYRVDAIFDTAEGVVPGELVKIAGARVGTVTAVTLIRGPRARLQLSIDPRYGPFHADASCQILPEGPISEYFVECDPGSPTSAMLSREHGVPTVSVDHTTDPVSLQQVIDIFSLPVSERLSAMIGQLGIATAGNGQNLNAILQRANPALTQTDHVLSIVDAQNTAIATAVQQSDEVLSALASHSQAVRKFVDGAAAISSTTAAHRGPLALAVHDLPPLLGELRTNLQPLDSAARQGTPLLTELRAAAPGLTLLNSTLPAFAREGVPASIALAAAARAGNRTIPLADPVVAKLRTLAAGLGTPALRLAQLLTSTRDKGGFEGLLHLIYALSTDSAAYDSTSHVVAATINAFPQCLLNAHATDCSHAYYAPDNGELPVNSSASSKQALDVRQVRALLNYLLK